MVDGGLKLGGNFLRVRLIVFYLFSSNLKLIGVHRGHSTPIHRIYIGDTALGRTRHQRTSGTQHSATEEAIFRPCWGVAQCQVRGLEGGCDPELTC